MKTRFWVGFVFLLGCSEVESPAKTEDAALMDMSTDVATDTSMEPTPECKDDTACALDQRCVNGACACDPQACAPGWECVEGARHCRQSMTSMCRPEECPEGTVCSPEFGVCVLKPTPKDCGMSESCGDGVSCQGTRGVCKDGCCVECLDGDDCGEGQVCQQSVCVDRPWECSQECMSGADCGAQAPFCSQGCCAECQGNFDCEGEQSCHKGMCVSGLTCVDKPDLCHGDQVCDTQTARCVARPVACASQEPACPMGFTCDMESNTCVSESSCGFCNADCSCPGDLVCNNGFCTGCTGTVGQDPECKTDGAPDGALCLGGTCVVL